MKNIFFVILLIFVSSCSHKTIVKNNSVSPEESIRNVMKMQENAWNRGDLTAFMQGYWKSDSLKFVGSRGISYGWNNTLENYKKSYPNTEIMGKLHFDIDLIEKLSEDTYYLIGRYTLTRKNDTPAGYFNLIWKNINGKWYIVTDMTCG
ncbi:MAG TPA: nuclear transport factor 2 family protein [Bacteroidetes bacterium]|nr:nuclear transport factor 2 family protein [Bacteroidota bacterium]